MVAQLGFLGGELGSVAVGKRIGSVEDVIEEGESSFDLEVVRGASAAGHLLIELPTLSTGNVSRTRPSAAPTR